MPQPYPKHLEPSIHIGNNAVARHELYFGGMQVITAWSNAEIQLQHAFTAMLGANPKPAAAIFSTLKGNNVQKDAIDAVAKQALSQTEQSALSAIMKLYRGAARNRDCIAHHVWATDPKFPDAIILLNPRKYIALPVTVSGIFADPNEVKTKMDQIPELLRSAASIWKSNDFKEAYDRIVRVTDLLLKFNMVCLCRNDDLKRSSILASLLSEPEILESLSRSDQSQKNHP